jgi:hypothetical protein
MKSEVILCVVLVTLFFVSVFPIIASARAKANFAGSTAPAMPFKPYVAFMHEAVREGSLMDPNSLPPAVYDEQLWLMFPQNFTSLDYNVTAVEQVDSYGYGPAYLLNGLTDKGYWYQVGLSFDWPYVGGGYAAGFHFDYEVFNNTGKSIFPASGYSGLESFSGPVNNGDDVLLNLHFSSGNVMMYAYDWNTGASANETYTADGANLFQGQTSAASNANGYFTGLMTEWYHPNVYYGGEAKVVYGNTAVALSSGWLGADEYVPSNGTALFVSGQYVSFFNLTQLHYFTKNGTVEAASGYTFITGGTLPLSATISPSSLTKDVGQSQLFNCNATGGTTPYSYQWYLNASAVSGANGSSWTCTFNSSGAYTVYLRVTDSATPTANTQQSNTVAITINAAPSVAASPNFSTIDFGQSQTFTSAISGGTSPYSYQWYLNGAPVSGATGASWTFTPASAGSYTVYVKVTDSVGVQAVSNTALVRVLFLHPPSPVIGPFYASCGIEYCIVRFPEGKRPIRFILNYW